MSFNSMQYSFRPGLLLGRAFGIASLMVLFACHGGGGSAPPPDPVITSFQAAKSPITRGTSTTLTGVFSNGSGAVDQGVGAVTSGTIATVSPTADTTYTLTVTNSAGTKVTATASVAVVAAPTSSVITAPANVTAGQTGYTASIPAQTGCTYLWSITNGTITAGAATAAVTFTPTTPGTLSLSCVVTNAAGTSVTVGPFNATSVAPPAATSLVAAANPVPYGGATTLTPTFSSGTGTVDNGVGTVTSGTAFASGTITAAKTFTLTVTNAAGTTATTSLNLTVQTVVVGPLVPAAPLREVGTSTTFSTTASGGATNGLVWSATAGTINAATGVWTAPATAQSVTIKATSVDDPTKSASTVVTVVGLPQITSLSAAANPVPFAGPASLTAVFVNGTGTVDNGVGTVTSGTPFATGAITATKTFTLTVTNAAGTKVTAPLTVDPKVVSLATLFPHSPIRSVNTVTTFSTLVTGGATGTVTWTADGGTINASTGVWTAPATEKVVTITATSNDDPTKSTSTSATVVALPVALGLVAETNPVPFGGSTNLTATFSGGSGRVDSSIASTTSGLVVSSGPITARRTFTLTVTNAAGATDTKTLTLDPQTVAVTAVSPAAPTRTASTSTTFSATATGGNTNSLVWSASAGTINASTGAWTAPATAQAVTITATSADDPTKSTSTTVTVVAPPTTPVLTAPSYVTTNQANYTASVGVQGTCTYAWTISGGTITAGSSTSSITFTAGVSGTVGLSCVVTNAAGTASPAGTASATIVNAPVATSLVATTNPVPYGGGTLITPTFTDGTGSVNNGVGVISSGSHFGSGIITASKTFILTVTNLAGTTATKTLVLDPQTVAVTAVSPSGISRTTGTVTTFTATATGGASNELVWSATGGTIDASTGAWTAPGTVQTVTIRATSVDDPTKSATATVSVVLPPTTPILTAPVYVTTGQAGYSASITAQTGSTYAWSITNGEITTGGTSTAISFKAGTTGTVGLSCVVTNAGGTASAPGTASATIVAAPAVPSLAVPAYATAGKGGYTASVTSPQDGCTYAWTLTNGTITAGAATTSLTFTAGSVGNVGLSCIATNLAGTASAAGTGTTPVVAYPAITIFSATPTDVASAGASTLSCSYTGGTGVITPGSLSIAANGSVVVNPAVTTTYTLTVTNNAGDSTVADCTVTVVGAPTISLFKAASTSLTVGQGTLLTFAFDGDGVIDNGVGSVLTGGQVAVFPTLETTVYTLTVTNSVGLTATKTVTLNLNTFTGKFVYVANSGGGVAGFTLDDNTGALVEIQGSPWDDTTDALHVTTDPSGKFLYVVNGDGVALPSTLTAYAIDGTSGALTLIGVYPTGSNPWAAAVDPSGKYVYVRCEGGISVFRINATTGVLTPRAGAVTNTGTGGILIHPSGTLLFTVGRDSASLQVFNLDPTTGALSPNGSYGLTVGNGPLTLALSHSGEYLITKSEGTAGGDAQDCFVYVYQVDLQSGALTGPITTDTGMQQADSYHGVSANPVLPVVYITLATSGNDYAAYALNLLTGALTPLAGTTYDLFSGTGADNLVVTRNGRWGIITNFSSGMVAVCAVDSLTGVLLPTPVLYPTGRLPVAATVVGTLAEVNN